MPFDKRVQRVYNKDMKQRTNVRLDEQARQDAQLIAKAYNLGSTSAAIRYALREVARQIEQGTDDDKRRDN